MDAGKEGNIELFINNTWFIWELAPHFRAMLYIKVKIIVASWAMIMQKLKLCMQLHRQCWRRG